MTIFGWDMSHFDAPSIGNAVEQGIDFITHKAGGDAVDTELPTWWDHIQAYRPAVLLGAYWVLYPGSPASRADSFIARLDDTCPGWRDGPFILQADCEKWNGDASTVPSKTEIQAFCDRLVLRCPKLRPIVYAPKWVYGDKLTGLPYPLWSSTYVIGSGGFKALYPGDSSSRWAAYSGQTPAILQYTSSASIGGQSTCDANAFRGTLAQLTRLLAPRWSTVATLDTDDKKWFTQQLDAYLGFDAAQSDGTPTSRIGRLVWTQGIPDGTTTNGARALAYQVLENLGSVAVTSPTVDPAAVASALIEMGIGLDVAKAILGQLGPQA